MPSCLARLEDGRLFPRKTSRTSLCQPPERLSALTCSKRSPAADVRRAGSRVSQVCLARLIFGFPGDFALNLAYRGHEGQLRKKLRTMIDDVQQDLSG